jgi:1-acyl-sn-glycerol-3-phosphate acyltransferase
VIATLPDTSRVHPPRVAALRLGRPPVRAILGSRWDLRGHGADRVPRRGAQIVASNHIGLIDGPLMAAVHPRPVHMLTKREMFHGKTGAALRLFAQLPLTREHVDPEAMKTSVRILRDGGAIGIFPEGTRGAGDLAQTQRGVAYLALVTGAPVVPVTVFGSREAGAHTNSLPARGSRIDVVYGRPIAVDPRPWPRTKEQTGETLALLTEALRAHLSAACDLTGRELPGPIPGVPA